MAVSAPIRPDESIPRSRSAFAMFTGYEKYIRLVRSVMPNTMLIICHGNFVIAGEYTAVPAAGGPVSHKSSSTAKNFTALLGPGYREKLSGVKIASIGPITSQALTALGLAPTIQADAFNVEGLLEAIQNAAG